MHGGIDDRSGDRQADRPGHAAPVARSWRPKTSPATSAAATPRYSCAYMNTISWTVADDAAADGDQSARGVRAACSAAPGTAAQRAGAHADRQEHPRLGHARTRRICRAGSAPEDRARLSDYLDNVREIERRIQKAEKQATTTVTRAGRADRHARVVRGARRRCMFDLLAARVPGRHHARVHVHDGARRQPARVPEPRHHRAAPLDVAPRQQPGEDREARQAEHVSHGAVRQVPREAARRRRTATARCSITRSSSTAAA